MEDQNVRRVKGASFIKTCINAINVLSGYGLITMPFALAQGGWVTLGLLLLIASITYYTALLLIRCLMKFESMNSYADVAFQAFGHKGSMLISFFLYTELYFVPTGFLIVEADNLFKLFPHFGIKLGQLYLTGKPFFTVLVGLIILPTMLMRDLRYLSYISVCGIIATYVIIASIVWVGFDGVGFSGEGDRILNLKGIPTALSLYAFCYGSHPVFPVLYSSMRRKNHFFRVLCITFFICTMNYTLVAILGYLMFGKDVQSEVTLNMDPTKISSKIVIYTTLAIPLVKYALCISPIPEAIEKKLPNTWNNRLVCIAIRTLLLASTVGVALAFPHFESLAGLVGSILCVSLSIVFPCVCYLKMFELYRNLNFEVVIVYIIITSAVAIGVMGTYGSVKEII